VIGKVTTPTTNYAAGIYGAYMFPPELQAALGIVP